jgi:DNA polymerase
MKSLHVDIETYSDVDLKKCGVARYAESQQFDVMLFGYAVDDGPAEVVDLAAGESIPAGIVDAMFDHNVRKKAFNAQFEMTCLAQYFGEYLPPEQWECTSVHGLYLGLPNDLDSVCGVINAPPEFRKQKAGYGLIRVFCLPCKPTIKNGGRTRNFPQHEPEKWALFRDYCRADVIAERYVASKLAKFPVPEKERRLWILDQHMFRRGVGVDMGLVTAAIEAAEQTKARLTDEATSLTGLSNPNSVKQLAEWLSTEMSEDVTTLTKKDVPKLLELADNETVERVLQLRQELAKSSVTKYQAMARSVCADNRLRGVTQFYGANRTGRMSGRIVQLQNLPQNKLRDLATARDLVKRGDTDMLETLFGSVPDTLSQLIRTALVPAKGRRLYVSDFSAIEARVIAWLAWCQWRLDVFNTHGKIYEASAEQMFRLPPGSVTKKSPYRQKGKVAELACGFGGGVNALKTMGALDMGLQEEELQPIITAWRTANPEIVQLWYSVEAAMKEAIGRQTGIDLKIADGRSKLVFGYERKYLTITLPSGRKLFYAKARLEPEDLYTENAAGQRYLIAAEGSVTYEGVDQKTKRWCRMSTYGGRAVENITQAIARDCLAESMLALDAAGFAQMFTVHDEIVCEEETDRLQEMEEIMSRPISWAPDLPMRADGFVTDYYMKETD